MATKKRTTMLIKTIQKRLRQAVLGTMISGAMVFTPMSGCDLVAEGNPAAKGLLDAEFSIDSNAHDLNGKSNARLRRIYHRKLDPTGE